MQKLVIAKEKVSNPWTWRNPTNRDFTPVDRNVNRLYWLWEIKHNNLKVI